jgi:hypothetical protein
MKRTHETEIQQLGGWEKEPQFSYKSGDRPLDGYTIKRGLGSGGFGEVYYAVSDGGKEVAAKLIRRYLDVEIRGVTQCLNLKSPNLIAIYDVRSTPTGESWIIMEYLAGKSLGELLQDAPQTLPVEESLRWLSGIARAVDDLHEHGIVHRDLKPGNVFSEGDLVKVGDYGLSKFISNSRRSGQTQSIGTVHYMAPEISTGNYGRSVDIYSTAVIAFELLSGDVPFDGETAGEILMKHLTAEPRLEKIDPKYRAIFAKALAKNPVDRYQSAAELIKAIAQAAGVGAPLLADRLKPPPIPNLSPSIAQLAETMPAPSYAAGLRDPAFAASIPPNPGTFAAARRGLADTLWVVFKGGSLSAMMSMLAMTWEIVGGGLYSLGRIWEFGAVDLVHRRLNALSFGVALGLTALALNVYLAIDPTGYRFLDGFAPINDMTIKELMPTAVLHLSAFGLALAVPDWFEQTSPRRGLKFNFWSVVWAGVVGVVIGNLIDRPGLSAGSLGPMMVITSIVLQWISPYERRSPFTDRRFSSVNA